MKKWVYLFSEVTEAENHAGSWEGVRSLLGGKGAILAEMTRMGVPVPPGFIITTEACNAYLKAGEKFPEDMWDQALKALKSVEATSGKKFGDPQNPLLVSCRSSAKFSMPGMMDAVLNIGLNDETAKGMVELTKDERFVYAAYRYLVQMFGSVVLGIEDEAFEEPLYTYKKKSGFKSDTELKAEDWKALTREFQTVVCIHKGFDFPQDPFEQMRLATEAVFKTWNGKRDINYRNTAGIAHDLGTAVIIVTMVFGNMGNDSGTGVAFTRNPVTGEKVLFGDYLFNAQGEDLIAGIRDTKTIEEMVVEYPEIYSQLLDAKTKLENHYRDMQDMEFTIERGRLWILQTRNGKRTAYSALRITIDLLNENIISKSDAIFRVSPEQLGAIYSPRLPPDINQKPISRGINASPGVGIGKAVFDSGKAEILGKAGNKVILILPFVNPDDVHGMLNSQGVITSEGGATSHAAVACRQFGIPALVGTYLKIDLEKNEATASNGKKISEGDLITVSGTSGEIFTGELPLIQTKTQDDPYLVRYAALVWSVDPTQYIDHGLATIWVMRDIVTDGKIPSYLLKPNSRSSQTISNISSKGDDGEYVSFYQPQENIIRDILQELHWEIDGDIKIITLGFIHNLINLLQNKVGIGNHYKVYRPLNDPQKSFISHSPISGMPINYIIQHPGPPLVQLIGLEAFGINHHKKNFLDWESVQFWLAIEISDQYEQTVWALDTVNPSGEGIIFGDNSLAGLLVIHNDKPLSIHETKILYNHFRLRELGWEWYRENNTSWRELINAVECIRTGTTLAKDILSKCQSIGLVNNNSQVTSLGSSLLSEQCARDRKRITFCGRIVYNG